MLHTKHQLLFTTHESLQRAKTQGEILPRSLCIDYSGAAHGPRTHAHNFFGPIDVLTFPTIHPPWDKPTAVSVSDFTDV